MGYTLVLEQQGYPFSLLPVPMLLNLNWSRTGLERFVGLKRGCGKPHTLISILSDGYPGTSFSQVSVRSEMRYPTLTVSCCP